MKAKCISYLISQNPRMICIRRGLGKSSVSVTLPDRQIFHKIWLFKALSISAQGNTVQNYIRKDLTLRLKKKTTPKNPKSHFQLLNSLTRSLAIQFYLPKKLVKNYNWVEVCHRRLHKKSKTKTVMLGKQLLKIFSQI